MFYFAFPQLGVVPTKFGVLMPVDINMGGGEITSC
jgi:hypothetical protein